MGLTLVLVAQWGKHLNTRPQLGDGLMALAGLGSNRDLESPVFQLED